MRAYEFPAKVTAEGRLELPEQLAHLLIDTPFARVILLIPETVDAENATEEDADWERLGAEQRRRCCATATRWPGAATRSWWQTSWSVTYEVGRYPAVTYMPIPLSQWRVGGAVRDASLPDLLSMLDRAMHGWRGGNLGLAT